MASQPTTIVIFGASGDLTRRKLIPALFSSFTKRRLAKQLNIVGFARRPWNHDDFRQLLHEGMQDFAPHMLESHAEEWELFVPHIWYVQGDLDTAVDYEKLQTYLDDLDGGPANRLYYLATAPEFFVPIVKHLGEYDMVSEEEGYRRVVVEKPFGIDLQSAQALNHDLHAVFQEHQIYRIDHYLGKETAQNILFLRFANTIFEPVWNRNYVNSVQISVTEDVDVGHRAGYYDKAGVMRDMIQNHLMQLLALIAMEPPASFEADAVRNEKAKVFKSIRPIPLEETIRAQYEGYYQAKGVAENTQTATYAALKLHIDNWRWQGVPFYLRSGKALRRKNSEIVIEFKKPPHLMFDQIKDQDFHANTLSICVQPDEGIHLKFEAKIPGSIQETQSVDLEFHYQTSFKGRLLPDAYERLLLDALNGDATLFTRSDEIESAWRLIDPVIKGWQDSPDLSPLVTYERGSWGPGAADELLAGDGRYWRHGCGDHKKE
jgi:glucose-6-phosphate 1-dehydrogenase